MGNKIFEEIKEKYKKSNKYMLCLSYEDVGNLIQMVEMLDKKIKQKDVTKRYENMIEAFACDFNLPFNYSDFTMFDDLKRLIQNKNERLVKDIELLQEFSFGIRYENLKIIDNGTNWRG
jgi:hypothetical protein